MEHGARAIAIFAADRHRAHRDGASGDRPLWKSGTVAGLRRLMRKGGECC
ncbi:MAG TPA: hypothetical protein VFR81_30515 [Longimicrobium sp.]|nr:hypothetical protein [Longimicrobium sp.]